MPCREAVHQVEEVLHVEKVLHVPIRNVKWIGRATGLLVNTFAGSVLRVLNTSHLSSFYED